MLPSSDSQIVVVPDPDLLIRIDAHRMDYPPHTCDHSGPFTLEMGWIPKMDGIPITPGAHRGAIPEKGDGKDLRKSCP